MYAAIGLSLTAVVAVAGIMVNNIRTRPMERILIPDSSVLKTPTKAAEYLEYQTADGQLRLSYPSAWAVAETEVQTATSAAATFSTDSARVDFVIRPAKKGEKIDGLVDCGMKTTECEDVTVNGEVYRKNVQILNTGSQFIQMGAIKDGRVLIITATASPGGKQDTDAETIARILGSVAF